MAKAVQKVVRRESGSSFLIPSLLALVMFVMGSDLNIVAPFVAPISHSFKVPLSGTGWLVTVFAFGYAGASPLTGYLSDRMGRRPIFFSGTALFIVFDALSALAPSFWILAVSRTIAGVAAGAISPVGYALLSDVVSIKHRARAMSIVSMGFSLSTIAGVPLGLLLSRAWGWRGVMASLAGAMLIIAVISYRLLPQPPMLASSVPRTPKSFPSKSLASHWLGGQLPILYASAMAFLAVGMVYTYMPDMLTRHGASADALLAILLGYGLFNLAGNYFFGWVGDRTDPRYAVKLAQVFEAVTLLAVARALWMHLPLIVLTPLLWLFGAGQAYIPDLKALASQGTPQRRGLRLAWNNTAMYAGMMAGSAGASLLFHPGQFAILPLIAAAMVLTALPFMAHTHPS